MFVKPPQKLKRVLRVYALYEKQESEDILRLFGQMQPNKQKQDSFNEPPKFTSFFKQISFVLGNESQPFESVWMI